MSGWLPPTDSWPEHPKPHWRPVMKLAQARKWHLKIYSGHSFGKIACRPKPDSHPPGDVCVALVDSTAKGSESVVLDIAKAIRACAHGHEDEGADSEPPASASALLDLVERLLDGAQRLIAQRGATLQAYDLLDRAQASVDEAEELLEYAAAEEREAADHQRSAENILRSLDRPLDSEPSDLIDEAEAISREDQLVDEDAFKVRLERVRQRVRDLRRQLVRLR